MPKNTNDTLLEEAKKIVSQCDRCGTCLPACPLFEAKNVEASSARGKNVIARALTEGGLEPTPEMLAKVNFCLVPGLRRHLPEQDRNRRGDDQHPPIPREQDGGCKYKVIGPWAAS